MKKSKKKPVTQTKKRAKRAAAAAPVKKRAKRGAITGRMVQRLRVRLGVDVAVYARGLGVHPSSIYRWELSVTPKLRPHITAVITALGLRSDEELYTLGVAIAGALPIDAAQLMFSAATAPSSVVSSLRVVADDAGDDTADVAVWRNGYTKWLRDEAADDAALDAGRDALTAEVARLTADDDVTDEIADEIAADEVADEIAADAAREAAPDEAADEAAADDARDEAAADAAARDEAAADEADASEPRRLDEWASRPPQSN